MFRAEVAGKLLIGCFKMLISILATSTIFLGVWVILSQIFSEMGHPEPLLLAYSVTIILAFPLAFPCFWAICRRLGYLDGEAEIEL